MKWKLMFSSDAEKALSKMDVHTSKMIVSWLMKYINNCDNPRIYGKALVGTKKDYWRYRIGSYRAIAEIHDNTVSIDIINIGHRRQIYR